MTPTTGRAAEESRFFQETGQTVSGKFLEYWEANGGLPVFGYPITAAQPETDPETGRTFLTQWFERNRLELHPENAGTPYEVLLGLLGKDLRREALPIDPAFQRTQPTPGASYDTDTGHNFNALFRNHWLNNGGLERFGHPISEEQTQLDPETGRVFLMQWFERARFEYHPENAAPYNVLLGLLGNQIKKPKSKLEYLWRIPFPQYIYSLRYSQADNIIYLPGESQIHRVSTTGQSLSSWGVKGSEPGQMQSIQDVATDQEGNVYTIDAVPPTGLGGGASAIYFTNARIQKFDKNGKFLFKVSLGIDSADGMIVDRQNNLYLLSGHDNLMRKFDKNAKFVAEYKIRDQPVQGGPVRTRTDYFTIDAQDNIYVTYSVTSIYSGGSFQINKYNASGQLLTVLYVKGLSQEEGGQPRAPFVFDTQDNFYCLSNASGASNRGLLIKLKQNQLS